MVKKTDSSKKRGFASMSPKERRRIASMGGKKVQEMGTGHRWDSDAAAAAARKRKRGRNDD